MRRKLKNLVHGSNALGADLHTFEAVGAVPDAAGLTELSQPVFFYSIPGVSGEAEGLGKSRGPEETLVDLQDGAVGDAGSAHNAAHDLIQGQHVGVINDIFVVGGGARGEEPRLNLVYPLPEGFSVYDQVFDYRSVAHRLDDDGVGAGEASVILVLQARPA